MEVRAGFEGAGRLGSWIPLDMELINEGSEVRAVIQVDVQQSGGRGTFTNVPTTFSLPVVLPRLSHRRYTMEIHLPSLSNRITARLVKLPENEVLTERDISMLRVPLGDYFCGILARDATSYDFIAALDLPPPIRRARVAALEASTMPDRAQLLGSFDCIIVDNAATGELREQQLDALQVWVGTGGLLIAVGGPTWQSSLAPLPPSLLPVEPTGLTSIRSMQALGNLVQVPVEPGSTWLVSQARPLVDRGARVAAAQDGIPLVVAAKRGEGTVIYLAFEPTARGLQGWPGAEAFWRYLITHAAVDNGVGSALVRPYLRWGRVPRVGMADFSEHPRPDLDWLWLLMGGYGTTLGLSLWGFGRRGMVGAGVGSALALTLAWTGLALVLARGRAESDVAVTRLSVIRPIEVGESSAAYTRQYVSILAKREGQYTFDLTENMLARGMYFPFPRPPDDGDRSWRFNLFEGAQPRFENLTLGQGQLATAVIDGQLRQAPGIQADVRIEAGALSGVIVNRTGSILRDVSIVVDNQPHWLGSIEKDQPRQVFVTLPRQAAAGNVAPSALAERLVPSSGTGQTALAARRDFVESLFSARFLFQRMEMRGPTLIGWLESAPDQLVPRDFLVSNVDLALLVQPLQPMLPRGFEGEIPAASMNRRDLGIGSGTPNDRDFYTVQPGEAITLQFTVPPTEGSFNVQQLRVNVEGNINMRGRVPQPPFTVSLFNWRAAEWQGWEVRSGPNIVPDGARFVSAAGDIRLRYVLDPNQTPDVREARINRLDVTPVGIVR